MVSNIKSNPFIYILLILIGIGCGSSKSALTVKPNYQLVYNLTTGGDPYNFIVQVVTREPTLTFDYSMTNSANTSGRINITQGDLDTSRGQFNYFGGREETLRNYTSVWISKRCFSELATDQKTIFEYPLGFGREKEMYTLQSTEDYTISINGKPTVVSTWVLKNEEGNMLRILNNPKEPLILEMNLDFKIFLKEINFS